MTSTTALEARVLKTFDLYDSAEATKSDLGVSWTDAKTIAGETGLALATVVGVMGSLVKKDLIQTDEGVTGQKPQACCLTESGVDVCFALPPIDYADANVAADWDAAGETTDALNAQTAKATTTDEELRAAFTAALIKAGADEEIAKGMGIPFPGIICATLRAFAGNWTGTRGSFIKTAQLAGFNRFTAQTQWQRAKTEIGALTLAAALAMNSAADVLGGGDNGEE